MSTLLILLSFIPPAWLGILCVHLLLPGNWRTGWMLKIFLGLGLGTSITSSLYFFWCFVFSPTRRGFIALELLLCVLFSGLALLKQKRWMPTSLAGLETPPPPIAALKWTLTAVLAGAVGTAFINFYRLATLNPHGLFDSWTFWNMRARFIFRGGEHWKDVFSPIIAHSDYPMLIPTSIARGWALLGAENQRIPMLLAALFTFALVGLIIAALYHLRGLNQALLGGLLLLCTPWLVELGYTQLSDVPQAYFFLAVCVLFILYTRLPHQPPSLLVLAGLMTGYAAWVKNEGQTFLLIAALAWVALLLWQRAERALLPRLLAFAAGMALPLATLTLFKSQPVEANDLINAANLGTIWSKITDPSRYQTIWKFVVEFTGILGGWIFPILLVLLAYLFILRPLRRPNDRPARLAIASVLVLQYLAYLAIYLITPMTLKLHISQSFERLNFHLYPALIFLFFLLVRSPEEALAEPPRVEGSPTPAR